MTIEIIPDYKGSISKVFLPKTGEHNIDYSIDNLRESLTQYTDAEVIDISLSRLGLTYSLWAREPAIYIGKRDGNHLALMTDDLVLYTAGSMKDMGDNRMLKRALSSEGIQFNDVPFFVIGGDCLITDRHAIFGWATPQVTGWAYGDYQKGLYAIKNGMEKYELDPLIIDDIQKLDEEKYHERRNGGFFHLDTVACILEDKEGKPESLVSSPMFQFMPALEDSKRYSEYAAETLVKSGYAARGVDALVMPESLWSPANILIDGNKRTVFLSNSTHNNLNQEAESAYSGFGYETKIIDMDFALQEAKAGARCVSFVIRDNLK